MEMESNISLGGTLSPYFCVYTWKMMFFQSPFPLPYTNAITSRQFLNCMQKVVMSVRRSWDVKKTQNYTTRLEYRIWKTSQYWTRIWTFLLCLPSHVTFTIKFWTIKSPVFKWNWISGQRFTKLYNNTLVEYCIGKVPINN